MLNYADQADIADAYRGSAGPLISLGSLEKIDDMSGPTTVTVNGMPVMVLLAAAAIRAGYNYAAQLHDIHEAGRDAIGATNAAAHQRGYQALQVEAAAAETRFEHIVSLAQRVASADQLRATRPAPPQAQDPVSLAAYVRALQMLTAEVEAIVLTEAARRMSDELAQPGEFTVPAASAQAQAAAPLLSQRLLARIAHLGAAPQQLAELAKELDAAPPGERADLLATELRRNIQLHIETVQKRMVQEATATVVEQSLKDLGYQVEEVTDTLFVEGGVVHFRRRVWGDYMVRMRVNAKAEQANFNVIRAVEAGANEISVQDHIAEDRWCAEFPALLKALEARGVMLNVTRRLEAGELPVQLVDTNKLPTFAEEETSSPIERLKARNIL